jgi:serine/threonine protein kinase/WD40 repeat protein
MTDPTNHSDREQQLEAVVADYIRACESDALPDRRAILQQHPELADDLRAFFGQRDRMNHFAEPIREFGALAGDMGPGQHVSYVGDYELLEEIARGGMGIVYKARQTKLGRIVAVKMIATGRLATDEIVQRFQAEAQAVAGLHHPHIVAIHEVGQHEGWHYFSMDYVEGRDLAAILRENVLPAKQAATYVRQMAEAIHYAHQQGTLHRDLKPSNILIDAQQSVHITDFGLAMRIEGNNDLTRTGQVVGTPSYMPPEQAQSKRSLIGPASDTYALGAILYECLTGRAPFRADTVVQTLDQVINVEAVSPRLLNAGIPRDLETICLKCLQKEPHRRYLTAQLLANDLTRFLQGEPISARPISRPARVWRWCRRQPVVASLTGLVLAALVAVTATSSLAYVQERAHRKEIENKTTEINGALKRETIAKGDATQKLYRSLVAQARANRLSRRVGQRFATLEILREASRMAHELALPEEDFLELRNEAIACFTLHDIRVAKEWQGWPTGSRQVDFDSALERYARVDKEGQVSVRRVADDVELYVFASLEPGESWPNFSPDGRFLVVWGRKYRVWDLTGSKPVLLSEGVGHSPAFRPDSQQVAVLRTEGIVTLIDLPAGNVREFPIASSPSKLAYHPRLPQLAISSDTGVRIYDTESELVIVELPQPGASDVEWHPDGKTLAVVMTSGEPNVICWNVATRRAITELRGHSDAGTQFAFDSTGDLIASAGWYQPFRLWNPQTAELLFQTPLHVGRFIHFSADGTRLAAAIPGQGQLELLEIADVESCYRTLIRDPALGRGFYDQSAISPDGRILAAGMPDGVALWNLPNGKPLTFLPAGHFKGVRFEPSGAVIGCGGAGLVRWSIDVQATTPATVRVGPPEKLALSESASEMGASRDGHVVAQARGWGGMVWDRRSSRTPLRLPHRDTRYIDVSPDGRWVATGSHGNVNVKIWNAATGDLVRELPTDGLAYVVFSGDGRWLVTGADGNRLWSVDTWEEARFLGGRGGVDFTPDGSLLAIESRSGVVRLLNPDTGIDYARLEDPHQDRAQNARFSADGTQLTLTTQEGTAIHVWNLRHVRAQLSALGLDWKLPPYPPAIAHEPLTLEPAMSSASPTRPDPIHLRVATDSASWKPEKANQLRLVDEFDGHFESLPKEDPTSARAKGLYLYFHLDDAFAFDLPAKGTDQFWLSVDVHDKQPLMLDVDYDGAAISKEEDGTWTHSEKQLTSGSGRWTTKYFELPAPRFANRQNGGADFRLHTTESVGLEVRNVTLHRRKAE